MERKKRRGGGSGRELREFKCKIKRIKPFVICYFPSGQPLVSHCSLDLLNQLKPCKPFQIYAGLFIVLKVILLSDSRWSIPPEKGVSSNTCKFNQLMCHINTWNYFILGIHSSILSLLKYSEHRTVNRPVWSVFCLSGPRSPELACLISLLLSRCPWRHIPPGARPTPH